MSSQPVDPEIPEDRLIRWDLFQDQVRCTDQPRSRKMSQSRFDVACGMSQGLA